MLSVQYVVSVGAGEASESPAAPVPAPAAYSSPE